MSTLLFSCFTKGTVAQGDQLKHGPNWMLARRTTLRLFDDHLECGDWTIAYKDIKQAVLYSVKTMLVIPGFVLKIETKKRTYHFGLNWRSFWKRELPFPVTREAGSLGYSPISLAIRLIVITYIFYFIFQRWESSAK